MSRTRIAALACAATLLIGSAAVAAQAPGWAILGGGQGGSPCGAFSSISGTFAVGPAATNGIVGTPQPGETYTIAVTGPGTGAFRIVGDGFGIVTYAGPATVPGSLSFTFTGAPAPGAIGVGYYFDSGSGTVTVQATCTAAAQSVPANDRMSLVVLVLLGGALGLAALRLRG